MPAPPTTEPTTPIDPHCPRCGYDQSGTLSGFVDACPIEGRCPECGLEFRWAELLSGRLSMSRWLIEHAPRRRALAALLVTMAIAPLGFVLWRKLRITHPIVERRLLALVLGSLAACWLVVTAPLVMETHRALRTLSMTLGSRWQQPSLATRAHAHLRAVLLPLSDVRYEYVVEPAPIPTDGRIMAPNDWLRTGPTIVVGTLGTALVAHLPPTACALPSPLRLFAAATTQGVARVHGLTFAAAIGSALAFIALPSARRRAKVRGRQVARCLVYLLATLPILALVGWWIDPGTPGWARGQPSLAVVENPWVIGAWLAWLVPWWWAAVGAYLRMGRALAVAISVSVIGVLVAGAMAVAWTV